MLPLPRSGCVALVAPGPSGSTKKPARALPADCLKREGALNAESRMKNVECGCYGLTPVEIAMVWKTDPRCILIPPRAA